MDLCIEMDGHMECCCPATAKKARKEDGFLRLLLEDTEKRRALVNSSGFDDRAELCDISFVLGQ